jgi:hypothetical protein
MPSDERNPYAIKNPEVNTGRIIQVDEGWLLNAQCSASITLLGSTFETAQAAKRMLEQSYNEQSDSVQQLAVLIGTHGLVFKELRHTLEAYRMRCSAEFEKLKADSLEYREAFADSTEGVGQVMTSEEIRQLFRQSGYSFKQFATERGLSYSAVTSHFGGRKTSVHIHEAAKKKATELKAIQRQDEVLSDLRFRAEELAGVPPTAAEALPIWDSEADAVVVATQIVERFRSAATLTLHDIHRIDPGGVYGTLWKIHGPTDLLTCAECRELMQQKFKSNEIPVVPVHPGCRCTVILDTSELECGSQQNQ